MLATFMLEEEEDGLPCVMETHAISILFIIMIFEISLATVAVFNHFKPQIYLEASGHWNNTIGFIINLVTALI